MCINNPIISGQVRFCVYGSYAHAKYAQLTYKERLNELPEYMFG